MNKQFQIENSIGVFDGYINPSHCDELIKIFEIQRNDLAYSRYENEKATKNIKNDLAIDYERDNYPDALKEIMKGFRETFSLYDKETNFTSYTNIKELHYVPIKCQKTKPGEGYHLWHVEREYNFNCRRALVYTVYLNTIEEGGETEFLLQKVRYNPVKGRVCIFPSGYPYVHRGNPPLQEDKYILTSWLVT
jgi:hypothetical protein|tara:strand:+ start:328 stop:903 length:576 start_codon:yes stop_codon:yes gene_type:complete